MEKSPMFVPMWYLLLVGAIWLFLIGVAILEAATAPVAEDEDSEGDEAAQQVPRACWRGGVCDEGIVTRRLGKERLTCSKCHKRHVG